MRRAVFLVALWLAGCSGAPTPPDWQLQSQLALKNFESAYLAGNTRVAEAEFARVRAAISSTGQGGRMARAELVRCAVQVASLDFDACPGYAAVAADAGAPERAYAEFLSGRWQGLDAQLLPETQRGVLAGDGSTLPAGVEPISALVSAGAMLRAGKIAPGGIAAAVELASANGWRRPLLAWLKVQEKRAAEAGDAAALAQLRRRIDLVSGTSLSR